MAATVTCPPAGSKVETALAVESERVRKPPITITCDCGAAGSAAYGERWQCGECGRSWDTKQIPEEEYAALLRSVHRYRVLAVGPPLGAAAVLLPLAAVVGIQFAILLFALVTAWTLFVLPQLRRRRARRILKGAPRWDLRPDQP
jgi:ribosomal protein S27AE